MLRTYSFLTVGRKPTATSAINKIQVLELDITVNVSPAQQEKLNDDGFAEFINGAEFTSVIQSELDLLDEDGEEIEPLSTTAELRKKFQIGAHDQIELANVEFKSKYRASRCERFLPPLMKLTLGIEFLLMLPLLSAATASSEIELFPITPTEAKSFGTAQSLLFMGYNILNTFFSPAGNNMGQTGLIFDNTLHAIWRKFTCKNSRTYDYAEEKTSACDKTKKWFKKGVITICALGYVFSDFLMNFQQYKAMSDIVDFMSPYSIFPEEIIYYGMLFNFWVNQGNDPVYAFSSWYWFNKEINKQYEPKKVRRLATQNPGLADEKDVERGEDAKDPLNIRLLTSESREQVTSVNDSEAKESKSSSCWASLFSRSDEENDENLEAKKGICLIM